jgi:hypothetical protein
MKVLPQPTPPHRYRPFIDDGFGTADAEALELKREESQPPDAAVDRCATLHNATVPQAQPRTAAATGVQLHLSPQRVRPGVRRCAGRAPPPQTHLFSAVSPTTAEYSRCSWCTACSWYLSSWIVPPCARREYSSSGPPGPVDMRRTPQHASRRRHIPRPSTGLAAASPTARLVDTPCLAMRSVGAGGRSKTGALYAVPPTVPAAAAPLSSAGPDSAPADARAAVDFIRAVARHPTCGCVRRATSTCSVCCVAHVSPVAAATSDRLLVQLVTAQAGCRGRPCPHTVCVSLCCVAVEQL